MRALVVAAFVLLLPFTALAQTGATLEPYVFGGASAVSNSGGQPHVGGGVDITFLNRVGAAGGWALGQCV